MSRREGRPHRSDPEHSSIPVSPSQALPGHPQEGSYFHEAMCVRDGVREGGRNEEGRREVEERRGKEGEREGRRKGGERESEIFKHRYNSSTCILCSY